MVKMRIDMLFDAKNRLHRPCQFMMAIGFVILGVPHAVLAQDAQPTPLELRVMQTRKFSKPIADVVEAIKTGGEDAGFQCHLNIMPSVTTGPDGNTVVKQDRAQGQCFKIPSANTKGQEAAIGAAFIPIFGGLISASMQAKATADYMDQMHSIKYDIRTDGKTGATVLRMRAYNMRQEQITKREIYAAQFKMYGEALFIQAIEINPAEQE